MVARLGTNFRFGNLAEHLGSLLLRGVAAVADVPRTEDVGLDVIANLLRSDDDGNCYAEDTFAVQFKAASAKPIVYSGHGLTWFLGQSQPLFVGRIELEKGAIELFPTIHVNQAVQALECTSIELRLEKYPLLGQSSLFVGMPWHGTGSDSAIVWLGPPLLQWSVFDLKTPDWADTAYRILKRFIAVMNHELFLLSIRQSSTIEWQTNDLQSIRAFPSGMKYYPSDFKAVAQRCAPALESLLLMSSSNPSEPQYEMVPLLLGVVAALKKLGIEIDSEGILSQAACYHVMVQAQLKPANDV